MRKWLAESKDVVITARDGVNHSALNLAAYAGSVPLVKALLAAGANPNNPDVNQ